MSFNAIGYNLTKLSEIAPLNLSFSTSTSDILSDFAYYPEYLTQGLFAYLILATLFLILILILTKENQNQQTAYDPIRAINISLGIVSLFGITMFEIGLIYNFKALALFLVLFATSYIALLIQENKE